jgi:poly(hydroxyalkanoate) depolymerase family esterase
VKEKEMKKLFGGAIEEAVKLTRAQDLVEATRVLMRNLTDGGNAAPPPQDAPETPPKPRVALPLGETIERLRNGTLPKLAPSVEALAKLAKRPRVSAPEGASFLSRTFSCEAGSRPYKVYVPSDSAGRRLPLIVMLHGCTQNADDFAAGTAMNEHAERLGFVVAYPEQPMSANQMGCWNWFNPQDQHRDRGEPGIIAGLTRALIDEMDLDEERVFVAGLSAGGAMAEIMTATYPDLYAGAGVHSGLAYGAASDMASAFVAMSNGSNGKSGPRRAREARVRTIIFHGAQDQQVHPTNSELILAEARAGLAPHHDETMQRGTAGGRHYSRTVVVDSKGVPQVEYWAVEGLGHAWSGGSPQGSHTDRNGPDASAEMLRFFLESDARG